MKDRLDKRKMLMLHAARFVTKMGFVSDFSFSCKEPVLPLFSYFYRSSFSATRQPDVGHGDVTLRGR